MASSQTAPDPNALRPWQFFTLVALFSATMAVFLVRGTSPESIIFICLAIGAAAFVGGTVLRTLKPLVSPESFQPEMVGSRTRAALEREKNLLLRSLKELEFDHAMGKIATEDFDEMTARLRARTVRLMQQLDSTESGYREIIERELASRLVKAGGVAVPEAKAEALGHTDQRVEGEGKGQRAESAVAQDFSPGVCKSCDTANDADARFCKACGAKLLLILLAVLTFAGTAWAQGGFEMPDPKQMSGIPRPVTDLPEGHISVRLIRGQLSNNIAGHPVEMHAGAKVKTVNTDENGRAEFSGVAGGTPVKFTSTVDGEALESEEFPAPAQGGIRLMLVATLRGAGAAPVLPAQPGMVVLGDQTRVIFDMTDDVLQVVYLLDFQNSARAPVIPPSTLIFDLPKESQGAALMGPGAAKAVVRGSRLTIPGPFPPGQTPIEVGFQMPYSGGDLALSQKFPVSVNGVAVLMRKMGDMSLNSPQLPDVQEREFQGEHYVLGQGPAQAAGATLAVNLTGLPHHSTVPRTIALALAVFTVLIGVWASVRTQQGAGSARLKQLKNKREKIFSELVRLEQQRHAGTVDASRYADRRPALVAQLERIYRELDTEGGQGLAA